MERQRPRARASARRAASRSAPTPKRGSDDRARADPDLHGRRGRRGIVALTRWRCSPTRRTCSPTRRRSRLAIVAAAAGRPAAERRDDLRPAARRDPLGADQRRDAARPRRVHRLRGDRAAGRPARRRRAASSLSSPSSAIVVNVLAAAVLAGGEPQEPERRGQLQHILTDLYAFIAHRAAGVIVLLSGFDRADPIASLVVAALMLRSGICCWSSPGGVPRGRARGHRPRRDRPRPRRSARRRRGARPPRVGGTSRLPRALGARRRRRGRATATRVRRELAGAVHERSASSTPRCRSTTRPARAGRRCRSRSPAGRRRGGPPRRPRGRRRHPRSRERERDVRHDGAPAEDCGRLLADVAAAARAAELPGRAARAASPAPARAGTPPITARGCCASAGIEAWAIQPLDVGDRRAVRPQ